MAEESEVFGRPDGARTDEVRKILEDANAAKKCPFCELDPKNEVLFETEYWTAINCLSPERGTSHHFILIAKEHLRDFLELDASALLDWHECMEMLVREYKIDSQAFICRSGDERFNSASVYHLNVHMTVSDGKPVDVETIDPGIRMMYQNIANAAPRQKGDEDPAQRRKTVLDFMDQVRVSFDALREAEQGRAWPIRLKVSKSVRPTEVSD